MDSFQFPFSRRMNFRRLTQSHHDAFRGLRFVFRHEQNFRIQLAAAVVVILLMAGLRVEREDQISLLLLIVALLTLKLVNSAVEWLVDIVKPRLHEPAARVKDIMAAAVLLVSAGAAVVGMLIFWPYIMRL